MNYIQTEIDGVWIIEPKVFNDARGYFMEAKQTNKSNHISKQSHYVRRRQQH